MVTIYFPLAWNIFDCLEYLGVCPYDDEIMALEQINYTEEGTFIRRSITIPID